MKFKPLVLVPLLLLALALLIAVAPYSDRWLELADFRRAQQPVLPQVGAKNGEALARTATAQLELSAPSRLRYQRLTYAHNARDGLDELLKENDPLAKWYASSLIDSCGHFGDPMIAATRARVFAGDHPARIKEVQMRLLEREAQRCRGIGVADFGRGAVLLTEAASDGVPLAIWPQTIAMNSNNRDQFVARARTLAESLDPEALRQVGMFFRGRYDGHGEARFNAGDNLLLDADEMRDAFFLASCSMGADCGDTDGHFIHLCVNLGRCTNEMLEDALLDGPPQRAERLRRARDSILRSLGQGSWPSGFWIPR